MKALFIGGLLLATPLRAQPGGNCSVADCPNNFMPQPVLPTLAGKNRVSAALTIAIAAQESEDIAAKKLDERLTNIEFELETANKKRIFRRTITDEILKAAAQSDQEYLDRQEILRTAIHETYKTHNMVLPKIRTAL